MIEGAKKTGTDRMNCILKPLRINTAWAIKSNRTYIAAAVLANDLGQVNAGHDLSLDNIQFLNKIFQVIRFLSVTLLSQSLVLGSRKRS
jgi:pyridoxine 5'-phosphate synthase PdxJ